MKSELVHQLEEVARYLKANGEPYRASSYEQAAVSVRQSEIVPPDPAELDNVGESIREDITEFYTDGEIGVLMMLKEEHPYMEDLATLDGVGPKKARKLYQELGVETVDELETAIEAGDVHDIHGFGDKSVENLQGAIDRSK